MNSVMGKGLGAGRGGNGLARDSGRGVCVE